MNRHFYILCIVGLLAMESTVSAADIEGVLLRLSVYPNLAKQDSDEQTSRTASDDSGNVTTSKDSTSSADANQSHFNIGAGYTFSSGLHLGASLWQETNSYQTKTTSHSGTSGSDSTYTIKAKQTSTAIGPTIAYVHSNGFSGYFTPFVTVASSSESSSEYSSETYTPSNDPEPDVKNNSKTSGYLAEIAYHFRFGNASVGPELSYMQLNTKIDVTTTDYDTNSSGSVSSTTTYDTGKTSSSRILPMIGMSYIL